MVVLKREEGGGVAVIDCSDKSRPVLKKHGEISFGRKYAAIIFVREERIFVDGWVGSQPKRPTLSSNSHHAQKVGKAS